MPSNSFYETIPIDFDVWKALTLLREVEEETYNDVLRKLLKLKPWAKDGE